MAQVKGTALLARIKYIEAKADPALKETILSEMPETFKQEMRKGLFANIWYPFDFYISINALIVKHLGKGNSDIILDVGRFSADHALTGIYKFFYKIGSPDFVLKRAAQVLSQYFTDTKITINTTGEKQVQVFFENTADFHHSQCMSLIGWTQRNIELSGGKNVTFEIVQCHEKGAAACEVLVKWV